MLIVLIPSWVSAETLVFTRVTVIDATPARYFGIADSMGTVEPGKIADLVLLDANPLEDIRNTQRIDAEVVNGKVLARPQLNALLEEVEALAAKD
jgi:adenine deaminase